MCVFLGSMCLKLLLRDDFERFIWCLDHWLCCVFDCIHVCIFLFSKNCFQKACSTPGYLSSFQAFFSYCNLDTSSTLSGLIEKVLVSSIAFRWQLGRSTKLLFLISWIVPRHMHLSIAICSTPTSIDISTPSSVEIYWWLIYSPRAIHSSFLSISLSIPLSFHLPNLSLSLQTFSLGILKLFRVFFHLVSF